jgi:hypothetical protein
MTDKKTTCHAESPAVSGLRQKMTDMTDKTTFQTYAHTHARAAGEPEKNVSSVIPFTKTGPHPAPRLSYAPMTDVSRGRKKGPVAEDSQRRTKTGIKNHFIGLCDTMD